MAHKYEIKTVTSKRNSDYKHVGRFYSGSVADIVRSISDWGRSGVSPTETTWRKVHSEFYIASHHGGYDTAFYITKLY